jgi:hypothetical protein
VRYWLLTAILLLPSSLFAGQQFRGHHAAILSSTQAVAQASGGGGGGGFACNEVALDGLSAYWAFDENTGTIAADYSTGTHAGTLTNDPTWVSGTCGSALQFNSFAQQYTSVTAAPVISAVNINTWSISAWFKISSATVGHTIYAEGSTTNGNPYIRLRVNQAYPGAVGVLVRDDSLNLSSFSSVTTGLNDGQWHHVVLVQRAGNDRELYIDGASDATNSASVDYSASGAFNRTNIGRFQNDTVGGYFNGTIDQVRVYSNKAISTGDITALYTNGK